MSAVTTIVVVFALLAVVGLLAVVPAWLHGRRSRVLGHAEARSEANEGVLENAARVRQARRRLRDDPAYARRLRDRFTRAK